MNQPIPPRIQSIWASGDKIQAIKLLREATGVGLAEAKALLEGRPAVRPAARHASTQSLPNDVCAAMDAGNKIEAIKRLRAATGLGLKEAKDRIDSAGSEIPSGVWKAAHRPSAVQVPPGSPKAMAVVALLIAIVVIFWVFRTG